ncbi:hypothetical protein HZS_7635 [Henneguya salminicola]|nr:hypothetical protein HZS_7635 [Henneguya salminicola]
MVDGHTTWISQHKLVDDGYNQKWSSELIKAAKAQRYSDKTRINIFCALMTSNNVI